ncbi:HIRAN domain-containing protein [Stenotrophomonas terrae]|uniref:HIRAN domain-containing protein n=1 Tax=Stenotrophomonas terrae TaxID=405446 RepID=UPI000AC12D63|nr:HIRAN domain-containing protein [Stenotrophomonas terrae]
MKTIFIAAKDAENQKWYPVARVQYDGNYFALRYTKGALLIPGFVGFGLMNELTAEYRSTTLFPLLSNRVLPRSRPESKTYLGWMGLHADSDAFDELARSGGLRATDSIELVPLPVPTLDGNYEAHFFIRGIGHLPASTASLVDSLDEGSRLFVLRDVQNAYDPAALLLRTGQPVSLVGYVPRYYSSDFSRLVEGGGAVKSVVEVLRVNRGSPTSYRVLCRLSAPWPVGFVPCQETEYEPI